MSTENTDKIDWNEEKKRLIEDLDNALQSFIKRGQIEKETALETKDFFCYQVDQAEFILNQGYDMISESISIPEFKKGSLIRLNLLKNAIVSYYEAVKEEEKTSISEVSHKANYKKASEAKTITDKLANVFFSQNPPKPTPTALGERREMIPLAYEKRRAGKEITLFYDYTFNEEIVQKYGLSKKFNDYDFFVMTTLDNLYEAGNDIVTFAKIYKEMGGRENPTASQLEPIQNSILKGLATIITIDDKEVRKAWGVNSGEELKTYKELISSVLPVQIVNEKAMINGKITNGFVKINAMSPFLKLAKALGHVTAWDKQILSMYTGRKTPRYYSVMRFLMKEIAWLRNGNRNNKILYSRIFEHTGDKSPREQQLTLAMLYRLIDEVFIPANYIAERREEAKPKPGVLLFLSKERLIQSKRQQKKQE